MDRSTTRHPGGQRRGPDKAALKSYLAQGLTQEEIAQVWASEGNELVTRNAIGMAMRSFGLTATNAKPRYKDLIPWRVAHEHRMAYDLRMLRAESRRRRAQRKKEFDVSDFDGQRLISWKKQLADNNAVVGYNRNLGFVWLLRDEADGKDLIRRPGHPHDPYEDPKILR